MSKSKGLHGPAGWAPLVLRLALGVTFVWAGLGKVLASAELPGSARPVLRQMGAISAAAGTAGTKEPATGTPRTTEQTEGEPERSDSTALPKPTSGNGETKPNNVESTTGPAKNEEKEVVADKPATVSERPAVANASEGTSEGELGPVRVRRVWGLGLRVHNAANPSAVVGEDGTTGKVPMAIWPPFVGSLRWSAFWGWSVAGAELVFGALVLVGLLSRISGMSLAGVMLGALWLDQIGPAIQSGETLLGFLPKQDIFDVRAWMPMLWQLSLLASSAAVFLMGGGRLAVDCWLFGSRSGDDHDDL